MLTVVLPDGSAGTIPAVVTDVFGEQAGVEAGVESESALVLSAEGVRRLRALLAGSRGSGSRGTRRRAA
jgi:hypothetical protein